MEDLVPGAPEAAAHVFTWVADKALGGFKKALGWGWERTRWIAAQDVYDQQIIKLHGQIRIFGQTNPKTLRDVFTEVHVLDTPTAVRRPDPKRLSERIWHEARDVPFRADERVPAAGVLGDNSKVLLLGRPGAGKTTFLKWLALREAARRSDTELIGKIPIFITLREYAASGKPMTEFIVDQFAVCNFPDAAPFVEEVLNEGMALVLFDGLDEVPTASDHPDDRRGQVALDLNTFAQQYDKCHVVITCRIAAIDYAFDPCFVHLEVADFTPDQVARFVRNWCWDGTNEEESTELADSMLSEWERPENEAIRDLGRNPLLLTLLCLSFSETRGFPARRVEIYEEALGALLKKWDSSRLFRRQSIYGMLSLGRKHQLLARIAYDGFSSDKVLYEQGDLVAQIKAFLRFVPETPEAVDVDGEAVLHEIVAQHGIFVEQARGLFSFAHLSFQEYYTAKYIEGNSTHDLMVELAQHLPDKKWREVLLLTSSLLNDATPLMACIERVLRESAYDEGDLATWLRRIDELVSRLDVRYRPSAARAYCHSGLMLAIGKKVSDEMPDASSEDSGPERLVDQVKRLFITTPYWAFVTGTSWLGNRDASYIALQLDRDLATHSHCAALHWVAGDRDMLQDPYAVAYLDRLLASFVLADQPALSEEDFLESVVLDLQTETKENLVQYCRQEGRSALAEEAASLEITSSSETWEDWEAAFRASGMMDDYRRLREACVSEQSEMLDAQPNDASLSVALVKYLSATELFYQCLQLACLPGRRDFEDRLFSLR